MVPLSKGATEQPPTIVPGAEEFARAVIQTVHQPLLVLDRDLRVQTANRAFFEIFQAKPADTLGHRLTELGGRAWDLPRMRGLLEELLAGDPGLRSIEVEDHFPAIGRRIMRLNAQRIRSDEEGWDAILIAIEDVTEEERLLRELQRHTRELERSNRELESFAHAASHDLQEPLRKILAFGDRLKSSLGAELDERSADYMARMFSATRRMQRLIEEILLYSRVSREPIVPGAVAMGPLIRGVMGDLEVRIREAEGRVNVADLPRVLGSRVPLRYLIQNLLLNALKFRKEGQPARIRITWRPVESEADAGGLAGPGLGPGRRAGEIGSGDPEVSGWGLFRVEDEGIGFDPQYAERIFGMFERLHGREAYEGTGIGLALCRRIVERHGGGIRAEGRPGEGAAFEFTLPLAGDSESESEGEEQISSEGEE